MEICAAIVRRIGRPHEEATAAAGLVAFGWLPIGHIYSAGEGHNDMAMVVLMLLWLMRRPSGDRAGPLALAASAACKYTSAVLVSVDPLYRVGKSRRMDLRSFLVAYLLRGIPAAAFFLAVLFLFFRSPTFFHGARGMSGWQRLQPVDVVRVAEGHCRDAWASPVRTGHEGARDDCRPGRNPRHDKPAHGSARPWT
ncbi:hypothetical protein [Azospirillum lipoferum]|uniref:DUF2029 domain-containing protein n=1 Tax=Azospirillum lipoferum (strain 4B) TaxID=862719 RepID=G7ZCX9_AZOL4|nr:hypothetical protein [Azospirillum lipoferum]CBS89726.1 Membrane protein of unknown function [Azospirillum lipoferum 4B]